MKFDLHKDDSGMDLAFSKCVQKMSSYSWKGYSKIAEYFGRSNPLMGQRDSEYLENGFKMGILAPSELAIFQDILRKVPIQKVCEQDCHSEYINNPYLDTSKLDRYLRFYDFSNERDFLCKVLSGCGSTIQVCLGHPMRIVNVRCLGIQPGASGVGLDAWHRDNFAYGIHKLLIYLTPPGPETGTTEMKMKDGSVRSIVGPAGSWVFFNPTNVIHRGVLPLKNRTERVFVEVTVVPSLKGNFEPAFAGLNAHYPWFPWTKI